MPYNAVKFVVEIENGLEPASPEDYPSATVEAELPQPGAELTIRISGTRLAVTDALEKLRDRNPALKIRMAARSFLKDTWYPASANASIQEARLP